jgi:phosphate transport system permease protein
MKTKSDSILAWYKSGSPWIWLHGGAVSLCLIMVIGLLGLIAVRGLGHFWPADIVQVTVVDREGQTQTIMGERIRDELIPATIARDNGYQLDDSVTFVSRFLIKQGNRDINSRDFMWYLESGEEDWQRPRDAVVIERREWGNFYGFPVMIKEAGQPLMSVSDPDFWRQLELRIDRALTLYEEQRHKEKVDIGKINYQLERLRLKERSLQLEGVSGESLTLALAEIEAQRTELEAEYALIKAERDELVTLASRDTLLVRSVEGREIELGFDRIVRLTRPNNMSVFAKCLEYVKRFWAFVSEEPREANTEGGIFPAIFGTVTMVIMMSIMVTPFGVLAAIYLREYAKQGLILRLIRISVYNLAGVPSIVYGVFGLGFFVYFLGGNIDQLFYREAMPAPTFGTPGLFWASLTLALLTLPVVIVSTEEGLSRIPSSIRQGSLALGATQAETLWKVVVPLATPAMMTGLILAIARAAGEVAPLMLVGVVKMAPSLPIDGNYPYLHLDQKIMHLGFHIYDVGFQSPSVEAARPLVYATSLILVLLILMLNITAIRIRNKLRERYRGASD